jgi:sugar/nucleoside kinase (ribokinase family)
VTPDGQRTMRTCLGAAGELKSMTQLERVWRPPALLHCEGYVLFKPELARGAMRAARAAGALVSLDLASFETVGACRPALLALLGEGLVDVVFANEEEAAALAADPSAPTVGGDDDETARAAAVDAAMSLVLRHARVCVVSLGARGAVARSAEGEAGGAAASKVSVVDTIGAGDLFSAGFLYAYLSGGASLSTCCAAGCAAGAEAVQARGSALSEAAWRALRGRVAGLLAAGAGMPPRSGAAAPLSCAPGKRGGRAMSAASSLGSLASSTSQQWLAGSPLDAWRQ